MAITRTPIIDDDGTGTTGTVIDNAWKTEFYNQIDAWVGGTWIDVPFNAANFVGVAPLVWTVGSAAIIRNRYCVMGKVLYWSFYISWFSGANVLSGSPGPNIRMVPPAGITMALNQMQIVPYCAGVTGVPIAAGLYGDSSGNVFTLYKNTNANFALTDVPGMIGTVMFEVL